MIVAFFESIKYVGHLFPVAFLRMYLGYYYFNLGLSNFKSGYLNFAYLAERIRSSLPTSLAPEWYKQFLETMVVPNWQIFAYAVTAAQLFIGVAYLIGYLVRPGALLGVFMVVNYILAYGGNQADAQNTLMLYNLLLFLHLTMGWMGAGRCLGVDYFFYKRRRGLWW